MEYKGWSINKVSGVITHKRYEAYKGDIWHWRFFCGSARNYAILEITAGKLVNYI